MTDTKRNSIRQLMPSERIYIEFSKGSSVLGSITVNKILDIAKAQKALNTLISKHPLLNSTVTVKNADLSFTPHNDTDCTINTDISEDFEAAYKKAQNTPIDPQKEMIKCFLTHKESAEQTLIIFLIHHCISDGTCVGAFLNDFMHTYTDEDIEINYSIPSAIETLIPAPDQDPDDIRKEEQDIVNLLKPSFVPYKPELPLDTKPYMETTSRQLTLSESKELIQQSKSKNYTVHSVISAALIKACYEYASSTLEKESLALTIKYALDVRRRLPTPPANRNIFAAVTAYNEIYPMEKEQGLWDIAHLTNEKIHKYLNTNGTSKSTHAFSAKTSVENANVALMVSNIGLCPLKNTYKDIEILDAHIHATVLAPCPVVTMLTVNGKIHLDFSFTQPYVPGHATNQIADRAMDILRTK